MLSGADAIKNRKGNAVILIILLAGMFLISGCLQKENGKPASEESPDTGKGD